MPTVSFSFYFPPSPIDLFLLDWMEIDVCAKGLKGRRRRRVHTQQRDVFSNQENPVVVPPRSTEYDIDHIKEKKNGRVLRISTALENKLVSSYLFFFFFFFLFFTLLWNLLSTPRSRRDTSTFIFFRWQTEMDLLILDIYFFVINNGKKKKKKPIGPEIVASWECTSVCKMAHPFVHCSNYNWKRRLFYLHEWSAAILIWCRSSEWSPDIVWSCKDLPTNLELLN